MTQHPLSRVHATLAQALAPGVCPVPSLERSGWDALWKCARAHGLTLYLHQRWRESGALTQLPPEEAERYEQARAQNEERNRKILRELEEICRLLEEARIPSLVLKGLPLAQEYYGHPGLRLLYDLDLAVRAQDGPRVLERLTSLGYEPFFRTRRAGGESLGLFWRPRAYAWDAERVFDPERPVLVELHTRAWEPCWHGFHVESSLDLWKGCRIQEVAGVRLFVPSGEKTLVQLAVHYAFNALESNARLMHLLDLGLLLRRRGAMMDWDTVLSDIDENRAAAFCFLALDLARRICLIQIPERILRALSSRTPPRIVAWLEREGVEAACAMSLYEPDRARIYFLHWSMASGWAEKTRMLLYALLSPWRESEGGRLRAFARRMARRIKYLASLRLYFFGF